MKRASFVLSAALLGLAACASIPQPSMAPYQTRAGGLGFTMQGLAQFTNDQAAIELSARETLKQACNAEIENFSIEFIDATSRGGITHTAYTGRADCKR